MTDSFDALDVSVVICTYSEERQRQAVSAVDSLVRSNKPPSEILIVVDHNPGLHDVLKRTLKDVVVIESDGPQGLSSARNTGIAAAHGSIIAFLDDDATADPDW